MIPSIRRNFDAGGRPRWTPLSENTIAARAAAGFGPKPILVRTGLLRRTMGQQNIWTVDREKAYIQDLPDKIWYGKVHQAGATFRAGSGFNLSSAEHLRVMAALGRKSSGGH